MIPVCVRRVRKLARPLLAAVGLVFGSSSCASCASGCNLDLALSDLCVVDSGATTYTCKGQAIYGSTTCACSHETTTELVAVCDDGGLQCVPGYGICVIACALSTDCPDGDYCSSPDGVCLPATPRDQLCLQDGGPPCVPGTQCLPGPVPPDAAGCAPGYAEGSDDADDGGCDAGGGWQDLPWDAAWTSGLGVCQ